MFSSLGRIAAHPQLLILALMIFLQGSAYGATIPYMAVTAIGELKMSEQAYSALVLASSLAAVTISVSLGILSDRLGDRRRMLILLALAGTGGYGIIFLLPSIPVFVAATVLVIPFFQAVNSLIFVSARQETAGFESREAASINATLRAFVSAAWVVMPAALGFALASSGSMLSAWGAASACALLIFLAAAFLLRKPDDVAKTTTGPGFFDGLKELAKPVMLARMLAMASTTATVRLAGTLWPLILTLRLGGHTADVGVIAGMVALIEIPFMLLWAVLLKRLSLLTIIAGAGLLYGAYMAGLSFASAPWQIYALAVPGAAAAAALLSMPLNYFQDLFPGRPGLGTAINPINVFLGNAMTAAAFGIGSHFFDYGGTAWIGVFMALAGVGGLLLIEHTSRKNEELSGG